MKSFAALLATVAASSVSLFAAPAGATVMRIDFSGTLTSTTDATGAVFRNGTAADSGVGTTVSGFALWDLSKPGLLGGDSTHTMDVYEYDLQGCYCNPADDAIRTWVTIGGVEYAPDLNLGTHNTVIARQLATGDSWSEGARSSGHVALTAPANGTYDYLGIERIVSFGFSDLTGLTLGSVDFSQPFDWAPGPGNTGGGSFNFTEQVFTGGNDQQFSGTAGAYLVNASGRFDLTSMRVAQVPEPGTLSLFAIAGGLLFVARRRRLRATA